MDKANITKAKVKSMISSRGNPVANQFIIEMEGNKVGFQSYNTLICVWDRNENVLLLNQNWWDYSNTTRKYFKDFINSETMFFMIPEKNSIK